MADKIDESKQPIIPVGQTVPDEKYRTYKHESLDFEWIIKTIDPKKFENETYTRQSLGDVPPPDPDDVRKQFEIAVEQVKSSNYYPHLNPLADLLMISKRVHVLLDLIRGSKDLVDTRKDDYCKGLANGFICAYNLIMDSECKYVNVDSQVGHHDVVMFYQDAQQRLSSVTIPAPLTQAEGLARMYDQA